jgi:integrase
MMVNAMSELAGRAGRVARTVTPDTLRYYERKLGHTQRILGRDTPVADIDFDMVGRLIAQRRAETASQHTIHKELSALRFALRLEKKRGFYPNDVDDVTRNGEFAKGYTAVRRHLAWEQIPELLVSFLRGSAQHVTWTTIATARVLQSKGLTLKAIGAALGCSSTNAHRIVHMSAPSDPTPMAIMHAQTVAWTIATAARFSEVWRAEMAHHDFDNWVVQLKGTKTKKSDAPVPIAPAFRPLLQFAVFGRPQTGPLFPRWDLYMGLRRACDRAGMPRVTPNDLRRTHTTLLGKAGLPNSAILPISRHTTTRMLDEVYVHHDLESTRHLIRNIQWPALPEGE